MSNHNPNIDEARKLRSEGWSIKEIEKFLQISRSTLSLKLRDIPLTNEQKARLLSKEKLGAIKGQKTNRLKWQKYRELHPKEKTGPRWPNREVERFFNEWSPEMAYVLGYFSADGTMYRNPRGSCYIGFCSADKELIENVKVFTKSINKIEVYQPLRGNCKMRYTLQIGSKRLFNRLQELGFAPNKSLTLNYPPVPKEMIGHFLRGYFDGDGCAEIIRSKNRPNFLSVRIIFTSGSFQFLQDLQRVLVEYVGVGKGSLHIKTKGGWDLVYSKSDVLKLYDLMYPTQQIVCLRRKQDILRRGLNILGL